MRLSFRSCLERAGTHSSLRLSSTERLRSSAPPPKTCWTMQGSTTIALFTTTIGASQASPHAQPKTDLCVCYPSAQLEIALDFYQQALTYLPGKKTIMTRYESSPLPERIL